MRILLVNHTLKAGGAERQFVELVKGLSKLPDFRVEVLLFNEVIEYEELRHLPVKIHIYPKKSVLDPYPVRGLKEVISNFQPDIVHSWHWVCNFYLFFLSYPYKFIWVDGSLRDANTPPFFSPVNLINRMCWLRASCIVANSSAGLKAYGVKKKGTVIYNGLDIHRFSNREKPPRHDWSHVLEESGNLKVGMVARFHSHKDYRTYLAVADKLSKKNPHLFFFAIGEGPHLNEFRRLYSHNKHIIFTGRISFVERLIQQLDIGVLLTNPLQHAEGISNALLEFMCAAKPVIATRGGGTAELIKHDHNGLLIDALSPSQFEDAINLLINHASMQGNFGQHGRTLVYENFSFDTMINNYTSLYEDQRAQGRLSFVH